MPAIQSLDPAGLPSAELDPRFRRPLMSYFLRRVGDRAEAEDLTQQTFLRLLGGRRDQVDNPGAFVFRVAASLLKDRRRALIRRRADQTVSFDAPDALRGAPVEERTPERALEARQGLIETLRALDELGERTRTIFVLFRLEEMRQQEIADLMGLSRRAVEKHVMRATLHLSRRRPARAP